MSDVSALKELLERVEKAKEPDREIDWRIAEAFNVPKQWRAIPDIWPPFMEGSWFDRAIPCYTSSLDACVALIEKALPGWTISFSGTGGIAEDVYLTGPEYRSDCSRPDQMSTPVCGKPYPIALLIALLSALIAKEESNA